MKFTKKLLVVALSALTILSSCTKQSVSDPSASTTNNATKAHHSGYDVFGATITENFETGSKTAYTIGTVTFSTGVWTLDDALIGTSASDRKNGTQSVRIRNTGSAYMNFNVSGVSTVSVAHGVYGTDGSST